MSLNLLAGYRQLMDDFFVYRQRGELNPAKGLVFTRLAEADDATEAELLAHLVEHLRRIRLAPLLLDWRQALAAAHAQGDEFRHFFGQLWELQSGGATEDDQQVYLARLSTLMQKSRDPEPGLAPAVVIQGVGPIAEMSAQELEEFGRLLAVRMERSLPVFAFFRESYSDLLLALHRMSDAIWALDETTYAAEFYLMHPHGFRTIQEQNRRRPIVKSFELGQN